MCNKGSALVSGLIASFIGLSALAYLGRAVTTSGRGQSSLQQMLIAENYASELLEYFLSLDPKDLRTYLSADGNSAQAYHLCMRSHESPGWNDSFTAVPTAPLMRAKRNFLVSIVDLSNPTELKRQEGQCFKPVTSSLALSPNERFLISVQLAWEDSLGNKQSTELQGLLSQRLQ